MRRRQLAQNLWIGIKLAIFPCDFELEWVLGGENRRDKEKWWIW